MKRGLIVTFSVVAVSVFLVPGLPSAGHHHGGFQFGITVGPPIFWAPPPVYYQSCYPYYNGYYKEYYGRGYPRYYRHPRAWVPGYWGRHWSPYGWERTWTPGYRE